MFDPHDPGNRAALHRRLCRTDFPIFAKSALNLIVPRFKDNWHIDAMLAEGMQIADGAQQFTIVNAPPRSLKSVIFSSVMPAFMLGQNPAAQIICLSHGQELANKLARDTLRIIRSPFYAKVFPSTRLSRLAVEDPTTTKGG